MKRINDDLFRLVAGLVSIPAFAFQSDLRIKAALVAVYLLAALLAGTRIRIAPTLIFVACIVLVHLITPTGRVLLRIVSLPITEGALVTGLDRGMLLGGLVFLSRFSVRREAVEGIAPESLAARTFASFELLLSRRRRVVSAEPDAPPKRRRRRISLDRIVGWIDDTLLEVYRTIDGGEPAEAAGHDDSQSQSLSPSESPSASAPRDVGTGRDGRRKDPGRRRGSSRLLSAAIPVVSWGTLILGGTLIPR